MSDIAPKTTHVKLVEKKSCIICRKKKSDAITLDFCMSFDSS